ncbi:MAG: N-6 DNA methylase [Campylobacter hominis]|uniref:restriction endonuclease subunit M n=1 Tax=Campylobacter TaxID=194 RepID=UPI0023F282F1|nr:MULTISPECIES: N-6 DNA methylase [Campylobacter]MCI6642452.1 N-6 DNA methylase [Campylobacter sp.]MDD7422870.1 N-6 DNA methylase [Campylobacter hominis]
MEIAKENIKKIVDFINNQPNSIVQNLSTKNNKFRYRGITEHRTITEYRDEELVRAYLLTKLVNELGYPADRIEIEKQYEAGRPNTITSRIDVIVKDKNDNAFLFIEVKAPDEYAKDSKDEIIEKQLFNLGALEKAQGHSVKYLVLYTLNEETLDDECMVIDYEKIPTFVDWEQVRNATNKLPARYEKAQKVPYIKGGENDLKTNFSTEYITTLQKDLHNVLWGGGGTDDNEVFSSLVNLILAKIQDEDEKEDGERYDFQSLMFEKASDDDFESNETLFERINNLYRKALKEKLYVIDKKELNKSYVVDTKKFSLSKLKYTVQQLENLSFVDGKNSLNGKDILGDFFEGIIRDGFKQTKGQFFTPINIVRFMLYASSADKLAINRIKNDKVIPYMVDPSAGSGTFLIEYMKFITHTMKYVNTDGGKYNKELGNSRSVRDKVETEWFYPDHRENRWAKDYIYGSEINFNLGTATKVNMILHGDGSTNIFVKDGLLPFTQYEKEQEPNVLRQSLNDTTYKEQNKEIKVNENFDIIFSNPPFSVDLDNDTKKLVKKSFAYGDKKNSENLFIERYYQLLRENGRLAVVLPESIFDTTENKYIRLFIFKYFKIKAVISLPQLAFSPYTNTKTSILFAQKKTKDEIEVWDKLWAEKSKEYSNLKTRVENIIKVYNGKGNKSKLKSIKDLTEEQERELLKRMLKNYYVTSDELFSKDELIEKYEQELKELCKHDKETVNLFGYVNTWWVFGEVAKEISYDIFMAEAEEVGYKRTKRGERLRPNDLFRTDNKGNILIDDGVQETILDYMRNIDWE